MANGRLQGKYCVVTGAARGISKAFAVRLASEGARVAVVDLDINDAQHVAEKINTSAARRWPFAQHGVTVNAICPGIVRTDLWDGLDEGFIEFGIADRPSQGMEQFAERILLDRTAAPEDIAGPAAFLASGDSDYITGQSLVVDGGMVMQ